MLLDAFYGAKNKVCNHCTLYFLRVAFKTHFRGYFLSCQSAYSSAFLPIMALNCASVMRATPSSTAFLFLAVPESGVLVMR